MNKSQIKLLVLDVDGVLTDGGMYYSNSGDEFKKFNTKDGMGIKLAIEKGIKIGFLSNGKNDALINNRAKLLGVECNHLIETGGVVSAWLRIMQRSAGEPHIGADVRVRFGAAWMKQSTHKAELFAEGAERFSRSAEDEILAASFGGEPTPLAEVVLRFRE